jgi:uncharacterized protein YchJ
MSGGVLRSVACLEGDREASTVKRAWPGPLGVIVHWKNKSYFYEGIKDWSEKSVWLGFKIIPLYEFQEGDNAGKIVFESTYERKGLKYVHHETATFIKKGDVWLYEDGETLPQTVVRDGPKVSRNDPCPCGSGKKYKHCCGH